MFNKAFKSEFFGLVRNCGEIYPQCEAEAFIRMVEFTSYCGMQYC